MKFSRLAIKQMGSKPAVAAQGGHALHGCSTLKSLEIRPLREMRGLPGWGRAV